MGRFKRSKSKPNKKRGIIITLCVSEIPVWFHFNEWEFERKWIKAQMSGGIRLINLK